MNAPELARRAERAGAQMATVHGRTRSSSMTVAPIGSRFGGRQSVAIPVIVIGDCATVEDARAMLALSGAAGVMIGRAAVGAPGSSAPYRALSRTAARA